MAKDIVGGEATAAEPVRTYEFVRVGNYYVNSRLTALSLGRHLWQQMDQFLGSEGKSKSPGLGAGPMAVAVRKSSRIARHVAEYAAAKLGFRGSSATIRLPVPGDIAIVRRSGAVKVLDIDNGQVFTVVVDERERQKLRERVDLSRSVAHLPFAPQVRSVDLESGYFAEEFVSGAHPLGFAGCKDDFEEIYLPLLVQFLTSFEPKWEELASYAASLKKDILAPDGLLRKMEPEAQRRVSEFVERTHTELQRAGGEVPLVLSHGDYFSGNIVIDTAGHRAIDWANMGFRTPLHDLYYLYINHCCRVLDWRSVKRRAERASDRLSEALGEVHPGRLEQLDDYLSPSNTLRKLFYLECIQVPLVRCSDPKDRYLKSMLVRVGWFEEYERAMQEEHARVHATRPGGALTTAHYEAND